MRHGALLTMVGVPLICAGLTLIALRMLAAAAEPESAGVQRFRALDSATQRRLISSYEDCTRDPHVGKKLLQRGREFLKLPEGERQRLDRIDGELRRILAEQSESQREATLALAPSARGVVLIRTLERESPERFEALLVESTK